MRNRIIQVRHYSRKMMIMMLTGAICCSSFFCETAFAKTSKVRVYDVEKGTTGFTSFTYSDNKKDESTTEDNTPKDTEEKPDFKEPTEIEEDENDVTYVDGDKNNSNEPTKKPTTESPKIDESTTEDNTPKDTEEKPDFKDPEIIEEDENDISYISSLKNNYIALKLAIMTELANMNQTKSVEDSGPVLTYTSSKNC